MKDIPELFFWVTHLDHAKGFWETQIEYNCKSLATSTAPTAVIQSQTKTFLLAGVSNSLQYVMSHTLKSLFEYAQAYMDDDVEFS
ncbi:hypothetical protein NPIL_42181 [Nephila pilipes]|uniref:Uncharacterized protein n=1 Tax=Nephila pilipes TaxID=299642 RepID=A0A8X6PCU2_NEPPI|nr:hypothetical protein NPIL_42181 [Nephila pilipes]